MDQERILLLLLRDTVTRMMMEASPLVMLLPMVPSEKRPVELTVSPVESMVTLIQRESRESTPTHLVCPALEMRRKVRTTFRVLMVISALMILLIQRKDSDKLSLNS